MQPWATDWFTANVWFSRLRLVVGSGMPPSIDLEAVQVHKYAVEHPEEDVEQSAEGDVPEPTPDLSVAASSKAAAMDVSADPTWTETCR